MEICILLLLCDTDFICQNLWLKRGSNISDVHDVMKNAIASSIASVCVNGDVHVLRGRKIYFLLWVMCMQELQKAFKLVA